MYFIIKDNEFRLGRSLFRLLGYIRMGVVFLQGFLLQCNSQDLLKKKQTLQAHNHELFSAGESSWN